MTLAGLLAAATVIGWRRFRFPRVRRHRVAEAAYYEAVAAELRRGASLRHALAIPLPGSRPARLALSGQPIEEVIAALGVELGVSDRLMAGGVELAARSGGPGAALFARLADRCRQREEMRRQRRALSASARLSAGVVGLLPPVTAAVLLLMRGPETLSSSGPGRAMMAVGAGLELAGLAVMFLLLWRRR